MSIASEISRLQTAKEDLAASIEAKGVTVPAATKLDGYPALVDAIQAGSGGGGVTVEALSVTSNGTYTAPTGTAYSPVTVNVSGGGGDIETINKLISGEMGNESYTFPITTLGRCFSSTTGAFSLSMPNLTNVRAKYAVERSEIVSFSAPLLTSGNPYMFSTCASLQSVDLPSLTEIAEYMFFECYSLPKLFFPNAIARDFAAAKSGIVTAVVAGTGTQWKQFNQCTSLTAIDLGSSTTRITTMCKDCPSLTTIILRPTDLVGLYNSGDFSGTVFANGGTGGTIYIPEVLYDHLGDGTALDYKAATNWSVIDGYGTITWAQIEGSYYETHYADGTEIRQGGTA